MIIGGLNYGCSCEFKFIDTSVVKTLLLRLNFVNCWNAVRAKITTTWLETTSVKVKNILDLVISSRAPKTIGYGEGSETIPSGSRIQANSKCEARHLISVLKI